MTDGDAVFLDTSIMIARFVHSPELKRRISDRLSEFKFVTTSLVVRYEFRRRLLKEALYLLKQLDRLGSLVKLQRHVHDVLPQQQDRKRRICLQTITAIFEADDDESQTERARLFLRSLLAGGLEEFDELVDHVIEASGCACGKVAVRQKKSGNFDVGEDKCSKLPAECQINQFFGSNHKAIEKIHEHLTEVGVANCSGELKKTIQLIQQLEGEVDLRQENPCLTVGDLVIALESQNVPTFDTLNSRESKRLCRALNQTMIVRKPNPAHDDIVCARDETSWGEFDS